MRGLCLALALVATVACGGTDSTLTDAGGNDGSTGGDGTTNSDGSTNNDGSTTNNDGSTTLTDAGNPTTVPCGTTSCTGGQVCCASTANNQTTYTCAASCQQNQTALKCIGNDCGTQVCCVYIDTQTQQVASQCQAQCTLNQAQLCQDTDSGPTGCSSTAPCSSTNIADWGLTPPFGTCGGKGN